MSELSKVLGNAAEPHAIVREGRAYRFALLDQARKCAIEKRLYQQAREAVYADREALTSDEFQTSLDRVRKRYELGEFAFFSPHCTDVLKTPRGAILLLEVVTGESADDVLALIAACPEEVNTLMATVLNESFPKRKSADKPNG